MKRLARGRIGRARRKHVREQSVGEIEDMPTRHVEQITFQDGAGQRGCGPRTIAAMRLLAADATK